MKILNACFFALLKGYQWFVSPVFSSLGVQCRFVPNCSEYAIKAVEVHGPLKGAILSVWRVGRCHPFCKGGHDPVPEKFYLEKCNG